jgi:hypothetical protein
MSNDFSNPPAPPPPPSAPMMTGPTGPRPFFQTWVAALTKPNEQTYRDIATAPNASSTQALIWVFIAALVQSFFSFLVGGAAQRELLKQISNGQNLPVPSFGSGIFSIICGAPIAAILAVIFFAIFVGVVYLISRAFNGRATFDQLAYVLAAITVPLTLVTAVLSLLSAIPFIGLCFSLVSVLVVIYELVVEVIAVKAVAVVDWMGAIVSVLALPVLFCLCIACIAIIGFAAFGATIGNVLSGMGPFPVPTP